MSERLAEGLAPDVCAEFFVFSFGVTALVFLLSLLPGTAVALKRFWRTGGDGKPAGGWMKPYLCLLRRFSPVGILVFSAALNDMGYGSDRTMFMGIMWWLVILLLPVCFLPEISETLLAGMREASDARDSRTFFQRTLAKALSRLADTWGETWKISILYVYLYWRDVYRNVYTNIQLLRGCFTLCVGYWLISLFVDMLFGRLSRRLTVKQAGAESK